MRVCPKRGKFNCRQHAVLGSFRACCLLCVRTSSGRPSSSTRRSSGPPRKISRPASVWRAPGSAVTRTAPVPFTRSATVSCSSSIPRCPRRTASPRSGCWITSTAGCPSPRPSSLPTASTRTAGRYVLMSQLAGSAQVQLAGAGVVGPHAEHDVARQPRLRRGGNQGREQRGPDAGSAASNLPAAGRSAAAGVSSGPRGTLRADHRSVGKADRGPASDEGMVGEREPRRHLLVDIDAQARSARPRRPRRQRSSATVAPAVSCAGIRCAGRAGATQGSSG